MMKIMISACLTGENCKYNGGNNRNEKILQLMAENEVITVCPEQMGGLPTPRVPSEIKKGVVTARDGRIVDAEFRDGAAKCLEIARCEQPDLIVLQSRSPSCGLILFTAFALLLTACSSSGQVMDGGDMVCSYTQISQEEAKQMMEQDGTQIIVDVRTQEEYDSGHIPGAICIPNESIETEQPEELPDLDQIILIYCRSGNRSKQAAQKLFDMGYTNIYEFGGINDWTGEVVTETPDTDTSQESEPENSEETGPASSDAITGEFDFMEETVLLNSGWEMPIIGTGTWTLSDEEAENSTYTQESFENDVILDLAKAHGKTAAQIILRWHLQDGYIAIPGSSNPDHIAENYDIFDFELSEDEMDRIRGIDEQRRYEHW